MTEISDSPSARGPARGWNRPAVQYALVAAVAALVVFVQLGQTVLDEHESKAALAAQNMVRPDSWIMPQADLEQVPPASPVNRLLIPVNNSKPRLQKPPLPYWLMAGSVAATGSGHVDELMARLPSAIAAVLCCLVTLALGRRMFAPRAALLGALMFATTVGLQKWGRNARPDMLMCLFTTAAMACFYVGLTAPTRLRRGLWMTAFWLAMGLANLCKQFFPLLLGLPLLVFLFWQESQRRQEQALAPEGSPRRVLGQYWLAAAGAVAAGIVATVLLGRRFGQESGGTALNMAVMAAAIGGPLLWYAARTRPWRQIVPLLPTAVPGMAIMLAGLLAWMGYMTHLFGGAADLFSEEVADRAAGTGKWAAASPHMYLQALVELSLPWIGFLPGALAAPWLKHFSDRRRPLTYLLAWSVGLIALLALAAGKREHYLLPMIPALCLMMGAVADDVLLRRSWLTDRAARLLAGGYNAAFLLMPLAVAAAWAGAKLGIGRLAALLLVDADATNWIHMLIVSALVAAPAAIGLAMAFRGRLKPALAAAFACITILYAGYHAGGNYWDAREPTAEFAEDAGQIVGSAPAVSWGEPQAKIVYYFGRCIPDAQVERDLLVKRYGRQEGLLRWDAWLRDPRHAAWMFNSYSSQVRVLEGLGFQVAQQVTSNQAGREVFRLMRQTGKARADL